MCLLNTSLAERIIPIIYHITWNIRTLVIIDNHLIRLPVTFTWSEDNSTSIFQHRNKIWHHNSLGKKVFRSRKQQRSLPFPKPFLFVIVTTMTLPYRKMFTCQCSSRLFRTRNILYPRFAFIRMFSPPTMTVRPVFLGFIINLFLPNIDRNLSCIFHYMFTT